ncbi:TPA: hypothetical protein ACP46J_005478, partial [Klebsiella pneumoniae]
EHKTLSVNWSHYQTARYVIMKLSENYPYKGVYEKCLV